MKHPVMPNTPNPEDTDMANNETQKISMTLTTKSINWLEQTYPEAQSTQEAVRMAVSDARQHHRGINKLRQNSDGEIILEQDD